MPIPHVMRRVNKQALNKLTRRLAPWAPGQGVVVHRGRTSGSQYQTPGRAGCLIGLHTGLAAMLGGATATVVS
jgi:hypothetical protein